MNINILNHSKCLIECSHCERKIKELLTIEKPNAFFNLAIKHGYESRYEEFYKVKDNKLELDNGFLDLLHQLKIIDNSYNHIEDSEFETFLDNLELPFKPYNHQIESSINAIKHNRSLNVMCTGSGKSLTICLLLEYFRIKGLKGILIVPNINLLTQFKADIKSYNLTDLYNSIGIVGNSKKDFRDITISTWQSLSKNNYNLDKLDFIICDEVHKFSSEVTRSIVETCTSAYYKIGFTGTLPDDKIKKMRLIGLFGLPKTFITSQQLIDLKMGTPIRINPLIYQNNSQSSRETGNNCESKLGKFGGFLQQSHSQVFLEKLKGLNNEHRNQYVADLVKNAPKPCLVLFTLKEHGLELFKTISKDSNNVRYMDGETKAKNRETIRLELDNNHDMILVSNYALLSTGVNIKSLRSLVFASPMKSYVTIVQSLGRGIRLAKNKHIFEVFDIVDKEFKSQYNKRLKIYKNNNFQIS